MRHVSAEEIRSVLDFPSLVDALAAAHRRPPIEIQDGLLGSESAQYFVRHAVDPGRYMASKLITSFPGNPEGGELPAVQALVVLFDGGNGRPLALMDGTEITCWRTAADSALAARLLAGLAPRTLLIVGAGAMAPWLARAHCAVRPSIRQVQVWNRTPERAVRVAAQLAGELAAGGVACTPVAGLAAAVREADIVSTCTRAHQPLVSGLDLRRGVHLDLVGGYSRQTREADDAAMQRGRIFVDRRESAFDGVGDIVQPIASGAIRAEDVLGDLHDLVCGRVRGRVGEGDITVFKNAGGAHLDLMTAEQVFARLSARG